MLGEGIVFTSVYFLFMGWGCACLVPGWVYRGRAGIPGEGILGGGYIRGIGIPMGYTHPPVLATTTHTVGKQAVRILLECFLVLVHVLVAVSVLPSMMTSPYFKISTAPCIKLFRAKVCAQNSIKYDKFHCNGVIYL